MVLDSFHPVIRHWFLGRFQGPTEPQEQGWPAIIRGDHTLIAAPTGSGKTLTAFLAAINHLFQQGENGTLESQIRVVYLSPLRALSNDMQRNLETPLAEISALAIANGIELPPLRVGLRTGDTSPRDRARLLKNPPHILVTTPESLYLLLTSERGRERLQFVETVIVDEIHALVRDKRGSHLALSLERLDSLCGRPVQRIGLSATQRPLERIAAFLVGGDETRIAQWNQSQAGALGQGAATQPAAMPTDTIESPVVSIIDVGHQRQLDLGIEIPPSELGAVCMHEQWAEMNARLCELITSHRSTLLFVNTRRMAERLTHQLTQLLGEDAVSSHHGSLAADLRLDTEQRLKYGKLKAVVATASLELGLDIGYIDLVIQIGSPLSISTFLQRVGRSGHALGLIPKGRLVALTRDELMECLALIRAIRAGRLDVIPIPEAPLDILAQQIVAEIGCQEWGVDDLFQLFRKAWPYRNLARSDFDETLRYLSEGIAQGTGRGKVFLHYDHVGQRLRTRPGARITAATNGGAIPEIASYRVVTDPDKTVVGTLDEEFAAESQAGDIFLLGNTSWRILHVRGNDVTVADAKGAPPSIPFWRGESPGRTLELSEEVSRLRTDLEAQLDDPVAAEKWLIEETLATPQAAQQLVLYAQAQKGAIGLLPTQKKIVFERFFDESGGMQLVIHAPFGARIAKAWGLAMRKRFCRSFDFELQATADDDGVILSLGPQHSFPLESMFPMLNANNVAKLLEQALLYVPTFQTRWRWNATRALLVSRFRNGKKVPPALQRFRADDLLTAVFPKLTGCQENITGDHVLPDHPLVKQSMHDSQQEAHDLAGLQAVLQQIQSGEIELLARDTREPSPFCYELLNANPYAFLDGGEAVERRTRSVATRRSLTVESVSDLGSLDPEAILQVCREAQAFVRNADELHDVLLSRLVVPIDRTLGMCTIPLEWQPLFEQLIAMGRATRFTRSDGVTYWVATERLPAVAAAFPSGVAYPAVTVPTTVRHDWDEIEARVSLLRGLIEVCGPATCRELAEYLSLPDHQVEAALEGLEGEGVVLRGRFRPRPSHADDGAVESGGDTNGLAAVNAIPVIESSLHVVTSREQSTTSPAAASSMIAAPGAGLEHEESDSCGGHDHEPVPQVAVKPDTEWCHRRLLSRIHRLTMEGLRKQIEPVTVDIFLRFLTRHHGVLSGMQRGGASGVFEALAQLQGLDLPAIVWERDLLPARVDKYRSEWLDELCLAGEAGWGRLYPPKRSADKARPMASLTRVVPLSIFLRSDLAWLDSRSADFDAATLSSPAQQVLSLLQAQGAMFATDLVYETKMLASQLTEVLGELVAQGQVTADGFSGLRALVSVRNSEPESVRGFSPLMRKRPPLAGAGRWSLWRSDAEDVPSSVTSQNAGDKERKVGSTSDRIEQWAWQLLRRWGVMFKDLLDKEQGAPNWFELLQVYRKLEARGEIRGGRFIVGVAGEQFAIGESVRLLRQLRDNGPKNELVILSAADPLNLIGILTSHDRVVSNAANRIAYLDGQPVAALVAQELRWIVEPTPTLLALLRDGRVLQCDSAVDGTLLTADSAPLATQLTGMSGVKKSTKSRVRLLERTGPRSSGEDAPPGVAITDPGGHREQHSAVENTQPPEAANSPPTESGAQGGRRGRTVQELQERLAKKKMRQAKSPRSTRIPRPRW